MVVLVLVLLLTIRSSVASFINFDTTSFFIAHPPETARTFIDLPTVVTSQNKWQPTSCGLPFDFEKTLLIKIALDCLFPLFTLFYFYF